MDILFIIGSFIGLLILVSVPGILLVILATIFKAIFAGGKAIVTGQSFRESYRGVPDFKIRVKQDTTDSKTSPPLLVQSIELRGPVPVSYSTEVLAMASLLDVTNEDDPRPVISFLDTFQEVTTRCFLQQQSLGNIEPGEGFRDWVPVAAVIPDLVQPPESGRRVLALRFFLVDANEPPEFIAGTIQNADSSKLFVREEFKFFHNFQVKGYFEASRDVDEAREIAVKIAMAVAMADGSFDYSEGDVIKKWIQRAISNFPVSKQNDLNTLYINALKEAYALLKQDRLSLSKLLTRLNELDEVEVKYETISLCYEIMAADGIPDDEELKTIRRVGEALDLDMEELSRIRDKHLVELQVDANSRTSLEEVVGIDPTWDNKRITQHLAVEFKKWNDRMTSLSEGKERDNAQRMLDRIAQARQKYKS